MALKLKVGIGLFELPFTTAADWWRWVDLCEAGGADSLWQSDRLTGATPMLEAMSVMAALAGRTRRLKFGMNVLSLGLRDPVLVARQCATIDFLSNGRLLPAFGVGSNLLGDWRAFGADFEGRGARTDEALEIIGRLWREDAVDFDGRFHRLRGATIAPKPVQAELPMWIGGASPAAIRRTARFGTGWQGGLETPEEAGEVVAAIKLAARDAGRVIDEDHFGTGISVRLGHVDDPAVVRVIEQFRPLLGGDPLHRFVIGEPTDILARIAQYLAVGISKFVLRPIAMDGDDTLAQTRGLIEKVLPIIA